MVWYWVLWILSVNIITPEIIGESVNRVGMRSSTIMCRCGRSFYLDDWAKQNISTKDNHGRSQRYVFKALFYWWRVIGCFCSKSWLRASNKLSLGFDQSLYVLDLSSFECQNHVNYYWFYSSLGQFLVVFCRVLICRGFMVSELFYTLDIMFHVFSGMKSQKEIEQRKV